MDALKRQQLLAALVESSEDAILAKDLHGLIQAWNPAAERLYGYKQEEVLGRSAALLIPPDQGEEERHILARIRAGERVDHLETARVRKDGVRIVVSLAISPIRDSEGHIIGASHIARNITERSLMEAATAQLAAIVDSSEDAIISKNLDGIILTWNAGAERIYGYTAEEARWRHMSMLLPPDRQEEETEILERLQRGELVSHFETTRVRKDGQLIDVSLTISPIRDNDGSVRGASHIARDITQRKLLQDQLVQTQKLEGLGVLAGGIAHDFNNLLVGILANASLLAGAAPVASPQRKITADIVLAAERAAALTRQLLAYAGKGRFVTEAVNLSALIRDISSLLQASIPPRVQVRLQLQDDLPPVMGDSGQLQQVVMNLVINAMEAIGEEAGRVVVTSGVQEVDEQYATSLWNRAELTPGRYAVVEVSDSGCGMEEAVLAKIFDPFFTTKFTGRGLGLAAVLGIVRGHKGAMKVYSAPGRGSNFKVFFPVVHAALAAPPSDPMGELGGHGAVLIIDDEEVVRNAASHTLETFGYTVFTAVDGIRGIQAFRDHPDIGLVLLDLTMPGMGGEEVLRELQALSPQICVLLSSGFNEVEAVRRFAGQKLAGFIQKPYTARALARKVKSVLQDAGHEADVVAP